MIGPLRPLALLALVAAALGFISCGGADQKNSPTEAEANAPRPQACQSISGLAPALWDAVNSTAANPTTGQLAGLRQIMLQLNQPSPGGGTPYLDQVLQALFVALNEFSQDPPEQGNTDGLCNPGNALPLNQTNRLCDLRRLLAIYVHEDAAGQSVQALDPILAGVFGYIIGVEPEASSPHYEIARDLEDMCTPTGVCDIHDTLDLLQGITAYLTPGRSQQLLTDVTTLIDNPTLSGDGGLFSIIAAGSADGGPSPTAEVGFEFIINLVLGDLYPPPPKTVNDTLNALLPTLDTFLPATDAGAVLEGEIDQVVGDIEGMLDPNLSPPIYQPLQKVVLCAAAYVPHAGINGNGLTLRPGLIEMIYHLGFVAKVLSLDQLLGAVQQLITIDAHSSQPGLLMYVLNQIIGALNQDANAGGAITELCHTLFETERACTDTAGAPCPPLPLNDQIPSDGGQPVTGASPLQEACYSGLSPSYVVPDPSCDSNVEAAAPEVSALFDEGVVGEVLCVLDTLVYGCAGGPQPACAAPVSDAGPVDAGR